MTDFLELMSSQCVTGHFLFSFLSFFLHSHCANVSAPIVSHKNGTRLKVPFDVFGVFDNFKLSYYYYLLVYCLILSLYN